LCFWSSRAFYRGCFYKKVKFYIARAEKVFGKTTYLDKTSIKKVAKKSVVTSSLSKNLISIALPNTFFNVNHIPKLQVTQKFSFLLKWSKFIF